MKTSTRKLTLSALFLALGLVLPLITGQIPQIGKMLLPMHIPVLLCGMVCGWPYGLAVGAVMPLLRGLLFGMPVLYPTGIGMAFELAAYGAVIGLLYAKLNKRGVAGVYMALVSAMLAGRAVWGVAQTVLLGLGGNGFTMQMFIAGAFATALGYSVLHFQPFAAGTAWLDLWDFIVSNNILPLGSLVLALFCCNSFGWGWDAFVQEANTGKGLKVQPWMKPLFRFVVPAAIAFIYIYGMATFAWN